MAFAQNVMDNLDQQERTETNGCTSVEDLIEDCGRGEHDILILKTKLRFLGYIHRNPTLLRVRSCMNAHSGQPFSQLFCCMFPTCGLWACWGMNLTQRLMGHAVGSRGLISNIFKNIQILSGGRRPVGIRVGGITGDDWSLPTNDELVLGLSGTIINSKRDRYVASAYGERFVPRIQSFPVCRGLYIK